ncbi:hypothetical protein AUP68_10647 [Ilyonectria robusta]
MSKALQCVASLFSRVFIVVDALDECGDSDGSRTQFLSELANLQANSGAKLFATLRHIPDIIQKFDRSDTLEIRASDEDIRAYLGGRASELPKCVGRTPGLQDEIKNGILQAADGMFLLLQLHFDSLRGKKSATAVRTALKELPVGSEAYCRAYENAMELIEGQLADEVEVAKQVTLWIICAKRPLSTFELENVIAVVVG